jgi:hypothetical protein
LKFICCPIPNQRTFIIKIDGGKRKHLWREKWEEEEKKLPQQKWSAIIVIYSWNPPVFGFLVEFLKRMSCVALYGIKINHSLFDRNGHDKKSIILSAFIAWENCEWKNVFWMISRKIWVLLSVVSWGNFVWYFYDEKFLEKSWNSTLIFFVISGL